jgi:hypothetical protein
VPSSARSELVTSTRRRRYASSAPSTSTTSHHRVRAHTEQVRHARGRTDPGEAGDAGHPNSMARDLEALVPAGGTGPSTRTDQKPRTPRCTSRREAPWSRRSGCAIGLYESVPHPHHRTAHTDHAHRSHDHDLRAGGAPTRTGDPPHRQRAWRRHGERPLAPSPRRTTGRSSESRVAPGPG